MAYAILRVDHKRGVIKMIFPDKNQESKDAGFALIVIGLILMVAGALLIECARAIF